MFSRGAGIGCLVAKMITGLDQAVSRFRAVKGMIIGDVETKRFRLCHISTLDLVIDMSKHDDQVMIYVFHIFMTQTPDVAYVQILLSNPRSITR